MPYDLSKQFFLFQILFGKRRTPKVLSNQLHMPYDLSWQFFFFFKFIRQATHTTLTVLSNQLHMVVKG